MAGGLFGRAVSVDDDTAVVTSRAVDNDKGAAYVFTRSAGIWTYQVKLAAGEEGDEFGESVSLRGTKLLVGAFHDDDDTAGAAAGSAYLFEGSGATWTQTCKYIANAAAAGDEFGAAVALGGGRAVVGATFADGEETDSGAAYVFQCSAPAVPALSARWLAALTLGLLALLVLLAWRR